MVRRWNPLGTRQQADFFNAQERRKGLRHPGFELHRTHDFTVAETGIAVSGLFPDRSLPFTVGTKVKITGATPAGVIFELGDATTGLAIWIAAADDKLYAAFGDAVAADGVTLTGPVTVEDQVLDIVVAVIPSSGKARMWVNGNLVASGEATGGSLPNGWAAASNGAVATVEGTVTTRVVVCDRIALSNAQVILPVSCYHNQRPRQFSEVS